MLAARGRSVVSENRAADIALARTDPRPEAGVTLEEAGMTLAGDAITERQLNVTPVKTGVCPDICMAPHFF